MKRFVKVSMLFAVMGLLLTGCNCYNKMAKNIGQVQATSNPEVLSLKGSTVSSDITVKFPAKYFNKKAVLKITPVLVFDGGSIAGTPKYVQGEKIRDNYTVISNKNGGQYTQTVTFPWDERAALSTLELRIEAKCKNGEFLTVAAIEVAQGVSTVQNLANQTAYLAIMPDNYKRITTITQNADVMYQINSSQVRPAVLNTDQIRLLEEFVRENENKDRTELGNLQARGYASPDGPVSFNDELSEARSRTGRDAISRRLNNVDVTYDMAAYGEDWEGFRSLVEASNIRDKDLILQVLNMYSSSVQRDQEIHNMSQVFEVLKTDILPQLRRTQLVASADIHGLTDAELRAAAGSASNNLNVEELLFAATLVDDADSKTRIYKAAADKFNDVRAWNNYGVMLAQSGKIADAKSAFNRAAGISSAPEISNNLGVIALAEGNLAEAKRYLNALNSSEATANKALVSLAEGDYAAAARNLSGYNLAVAQLANGNIAQAKAALGNETCAYSDYLRAIIAMREGDSSGANRYLASAVSKDSSLRDRAKKDVEFARIFNTSEFRAL